MALDTIIVTPVWLTASPDVLAQARALLAGDERDRADRFRTPQLQERFVLARAALRILLGRTVGAPAANLRFAYDAAGKPSLAWPVPTVSFNMSHSHTLALVGIGPAPCRLGVDVERHHWHDELDDVARRFFSPDECAELREYEGEARIGAFYRCWVRKEAYIKAVGLGLQIPLDSFRVSLGDPACLLAARDEVAAHWHLAALPMPDGFEAAVAWDGPDRRVVLERPRLPEALLEPSPVADPVPENGPTA